MLGPRVLDAEHYPRIRIAGKIREGKLPTALTDLQVSLHGRKRTYIGVPVTLRQWKGSLEVSGTMPMKQTSFGIQPLSLLAGSLKVEDEMEIRFRFVGRRK